MKKIKLPVHNIEVTISEGTDVGGTITSELKEKGEQKYNDAVDVVESFILAQACAGIDITTNQYLESIETAIQGILNNIPSDEEMNLFDALFTATKIHLEDAEIESFQEFSDAQGAEIALRAFNGDNTYEFSAQDVAKAQKTGKTWFIKDSENNEEFKLTCLKPQAF